MGRSFTSPEDDQIVRAPLNVVQQLYKEANMPADGSAFNLASKFEQLLSSGLLEQVPVLTSETAQHIPNNSLVRFTGMVQDMSDPQFFHGAVQLPDGSWQTTKYGDNVLPLDVTTAATRIWERRPLYCVPVPGRAAWTLPEASSTPGCSDTPADGRARRSRADDDSAMATDSDPPATAAEGVQGAADADLGAPGQQQSKVSRTSVDQQSKVPATASKDVGVVDDARPGDCIVHVYDMADVCLHDIVDVVGVVSHAPHLMAWHMGGAGEAEDEMCDVTARDVCDQEGVPQMLQGLSLKEQQAVNPPTSKVMRVHAILVTRNPSSLQPSAPPPPPTKDLMSHVSAGRAAALQLLTNCLGGDQLAAEYVLLASLGRVTSRPTDGSQSVVGMLPLNLTGCPPLRPRAATPSPAAAPSSTPTPAPAAPAPGSDSAPTPAAAQPSSSGSGPAAATQPPTSGSGSAATSQQPASSGLGLALHAALSSLLPLASYLPMSVESCNTGGSWVPRRDPDTCRVSRSPLQLPRGCLLLVDEVTLCEGRLNENGVRSLQALHRVLQEQVLGYDFEFCPGHPFPVELPSVVLSEARSLLHSAMALSVPLRPDQPISTAQQVEGHVTHMDPTSLALARSYLAAAARAPYAINDDMIELLQQEFVTARKSNPSGFSADAFQLRLTVARLSAQSWGEDVLTLQRWRAVQELEAARLQRCATPRAS